jgi:hypothetical protein
MTIRLINTVGSGLVVALSLQVQVPSHIPKGTLVNFLATHSAANLAMKQGDFYEFVENTHWFIAQKLSASLQASFIEKIENALFMDSLESDWSIILHNNQLYAVHNTDIQVVQSL